MNRKKLIMIMLISAALILGGFFVARAARRKPAIAPGFDPEAKQSPDDLAYLQTFLIHPEKMGSPDLPDDYKGFDPELIGKLRALSQAIGQKLQINSGHRSDAHNQKVGGVANSSHLTKKAVDIHTGSPEKGLEMAKAAAGVGFKRIGVGRTFLHVDTDYSKNNPTAWGKEYYSTSPYSKAQLMSILFP